MQWDRRGLSCTKTSGIESLGTLLVSSCHTQYRTEIRTRISWCFVRPISLLKYSLVFYNKSKTANNCQKVQNHGQDTRYNQCLHLKILTGMHRIKTGLTRKPRTFGASEQSNIFYPTSNHRQNSTPAVLSQFWHLSTVSTLIFFTQLPSIHRQ